MPKTILMVDDDTDFLDEMKDVLEREGFGVIAMSEHDNVLAKARLDRPDAIILDLDMRSVSGFEIASTLKGAKETKDIPIVALSGHYKTIDSWLSSFCDFKKWITKEKGPEDIVKELKSIIK